MGNQKSQTRRPGKLEEVSLPHSALLDIILSETIYASDMIKAFKASDLNQKDTINLHIFPQGSCSIRIRNDNLPALAQAWDQWISSYKTLHHPWVLKIILCKFIEKEIGIRDFYKIILLSEEYTMSLNQLLEPWLRPPEFNKRGRAHSFSLKSQKEKIVNERRSKSQEKIHLKRVFDEKSILKLVFSMIDALLYCYEKGFIMMVSAKNIFYCKNSDRFLLSPFALDNSKNILCFQQCTPSSKSAEKASKVKRAKVKRGFMLQDEDKDLFYHKDIEVKKQVFALGLVALKMATLTDIPRNLLSISKHLVKIKGEFPDLESILRIIFYDIFTDSFDIQTLLKHPLNDCIYSTFLYKDFGKQKLFPMDKNQGLIEIGKAYNVLENHSIAIQSLQKVVSDYMRKKEKDISDDILYAEVLKIFAESYASINLKDQASSYLRQCTELLDKISEEKGNIDPIETYCDVAKLYLIMKDQKQAIILLEKASEWYEKNNDKKKNNLTENWKETERELYKLKERIFGRESIELIPNLERLADLYFKLGDRRTAFESRRELTKKYETNKEKYFEEIIKNDWEIGEILIRLEEYEEALKAHEKCYALVFSKFGEENSRTIQSMIRIGEIYELRKQFDSSIVWYKKAFDVLEKLEVKGNKKDLKIRENLTRCYEEYGEIDGAVRWQKEVLNILQEEKVENTILYAIKLFEFAGLLEIQKDYKESFSQYRKCLETMIHGGFAKKELCDRAEEGLARMAVHL